jgi:phosphate transport system permease protein
MDKGLSLRETLITRAIQVSGYSAIVFVILIFLYLLREGLPAVTEVTLSNLFSTRWYPIEDYFGLVPLIGGSLLVTLGANLIAVPIGICTAVYIAEIAPQWAREILKPFVEVLVFHRWCWASLGSSCWRLSSDVYLIYQPA